MKAVPLKATSAGAGWCGQATSLHHGAVAVSFAARSACPCPARTTASATRRTWSSGAARGCYGRARVDPAGPGRGGRDGGRFVAAALASHRSPKNRSWTCTAHSTVSAPAEVTPVTWSGRQGPSPGGEVLVRHPASLRHRDRRTRPLGSGAYVLCPAVSGPDPVGTRPCGRSCCPGVPPPPWRQSGGPSPGARPSVAPRWTSRGVPARPEGDRT